MASRSLASDEGAGSALGAFILGTTRTEDRLLTFQDALDRAAANRHILLGNGFSRACRNDIFAYESLFDRADFTRLSPNARSSFQALNTTDFEAVMRALRTAATILQLYGPELGELSAQLQNDAEGLREVLASAIAQSHPEHPAKIQDGAYLACRQFLSHFSRIYSVNYDLLLYWALMHTELGPQIRCDDGFRAADEVGAGYVTWEPENRFDQNVHFLHGALHLFDSGPTLKKYTWINTGIRLIEQIRSALADNYFPLIVSEGSSDAKKERIFHSAYLMHSYKSLLSIGGSLFVYGLSFHENDAHIARLIEKNRGLRSMFVGIYGDPMTDANQQIILAVNEMSARKERFEIHFYDAVSAHIWG